MKKHPCPIARGAYRCGAAVCCAVGNLRKIVLNMGNRTKSSIPSPVPGERTDAERRYATLWEMVPDIEIWNRNQKGTSHEKI